MRKQLIVNADDYGRTPAVSQGILHAHREGIVTSTTVMINQPGIEDQLAGALTQPGLGVGLHLVFSAWRPILPAQAVSGLIDSNGQFLSQHDLWAQAERVPLDQLREELSAQVERFSALAGRPPDHFDCHHFVHLYPPFFQVYADLAHQFALPLRVPFPQDADFGAAVGTFSFLEGFPQDLVRGMIVTNTALLQARRLAYPDHFVSTFFGQNALTVENLQTILGTLPDGISELMCHPGYDDPRLAQSTYRAEREIELALLTHPAILQSVADLGIELVTFDVLKGCERPIASE